MEIDVNLLVKTCEITSSELILRQLLALWNHCGSVHLVWILKQCCSMVFIIAKVAK